MISFESLPFMLNLPWQQIKFNDLGTIHTKHTWLLNKHSFKNKIQISQVRQKMLLVFAFSIIRLWRLQVTIATDAVAIKFIIFVEGNAISKYYANLQLHPSNCFWEDIWISLSKVYPLCCPDNHSNQAILTKKLYETWVTTQYICE